MRALGIDPGIANIGLGGVEMLGRSRMVILHATVTTPAGPLLFPRVQKIRADVKALLANGRFDVAVIEKQHRAAYGKNSRGESSSNSTLARVGEGALLGLLDELGIPVLELEPADTRKAHGVPGNCSKDQLRATAPRIYSAWPSKLSEHAADAITLAGAGLVRWSVRESLDKSRALHARLKAGR